MTATLLVPAISALGAAATAALGVGVMQRTRPLAVRDRLESLGNGAKPTVLGLEEIELAQPFLQRVIKPILQKQSRLASRLAPGTKAESVVHRLAMAGHPRGVTVDLFLGMKVLSACIGGALSFILLLFLMNNGIGSVLLYALVTAIAFFFLPDLWIRDEIRRRQKAIQRVLPDTIDVLSISVEAGLGFDAAMSRICQKAHTPLTVEFDKYLTEMRLGKARREALRQIQYRTGVEDLNAFISAIVQADQLGVSIAKILRIQSEQIRIKRRQRAEQLAQKAPLKMLFPMILFIFPSVFIVILGPAVPSLLTGL